MKKTYFQILAIAITTFMGCQNQHPPAVDGQAHFANKTDYICGMDVQADWTDTCTYMGKTYAFCGASCKEEFLQDPEKYLVVN